MSDFKSEIVIDIKLDPSELKKAEVQMKLDPSQVKALSEAAKASPSSNMPLVKSSPALAGDEVDKFEAFINQLRSDTAAYKVRQSNRGLDDELSRLEKHAQRFGNAIIELFNIIAKGSKEVEVLTSSASRGNDIIIDIINKLGAVREIQAEQKTRGLSIGQTSQLLDKPTSELKILLEQFGKTIDKYVSTVSIPKPVVTQQGIAFKPQIGGLKVPQNVVVLESGLVTLAKHSMLEDKSISETIEVLKKDKERRLEAWKNLPEDIRKRALVEAGVYRTFKDRPDPTSTEELRKRREEVSKRRSELSKFSVDQLQKMADKANVDIDFLIGSLNRIKVMNLWEAMEMFMDQMGSGVETLNQKQQSLRQEIKRILIQQGPAGIEGALRRIVDFLSKSFSEMTTIVPEVGQPKLGIGAQHRVKVLVPDIYFTEEGKAIRPTPTKAKEDFIRINEEILEAQKRQKKLGEISGLLDISTIGVSEGVAASQRRTGPTRFGGAPGSSLLVMTQNTLGWTPFSAFHNLGRTTSQTFQAMQIVKGEYPLIQTAREAEAIKSGRLKPYGINVLVMHTEEGGGTWEDQLQVLRKGKMGNVYTYSQATEVVPATAKLEVKPGQSIIGGKILAVTPEGALSFRKSPDEARIASISEPIEQVINGVRRLVKVITIDMFEAVKSGTKISTREAHKGVARLIEAPTGRDLAVEMPRTFADIALELIKIKEASIGTSAELEKLKSEISGTGNLLALLVDQDFAKVKDSFEVVGKEGLDASDVLKRLGEVLGINFKEGRAGLVRTQLVEAAKSQNIATSQFTPIDVVMGAIPIAKRGTIGGLLELQMNNVLGAIPTVLKDTEKDVDFQSRKLGQALHKLVREQGKELGLPEQIVGTRFLAIHEQPGMKNIWTKEEIESGVKGIRITANTLQALFSVFDVGSGFIRELTSKFELGSKGAFELVKTLALLEPAMAGVAESLEKIPATEFKSLTGRMFSREELKGSIFDPLKAPGTFMMTLPTGQNIPIPGAAARRLYQTETGELGLVGSLPSRLQNIIEASHRYEAAKTPLGFMLKEDAIKFMRLAAVNLRKEIDKAIQAGDLEKALSYIGDVVKEGDKYVGKPFKGYEGASFTSLIPSDYVAGYGRWGSSKKVPILEFISGRIESYKKLMMDIEAGKQKGIDPKTAESIISTVKELFDIIFVDTNQLLAKRHKDLIEQKKQLVDLMKRAGVKVPRDETDYREFVNSAIDIYSTLDESVLSRIDKNKANKIIDTAKRISSVIQGLSKGTKSPSLLEIDENSFKRAVEVFSKDIPGINRLLEQRAAALSKQVSNFYNEMMGEVFGKRGAWDFSMAIRKFPAILGYATTVPILKVDELKEARKMIEKIGGEGSKTAIEVIDSAIAKQLAELDVGNLMLREGEIGVPRKKASVLEKVMGLKEGSLAGRVVGSVRFPFTDIGSLYPATAKILKGKEEAAFVVPGTTSYSWKEFKTMAAPLVSRREELEKERRALIATEGSEEDIARLTKEINQLSVVIDSITPKYRSLGQNLDFDGDKLLLFAMATNKAQSELTKFHSLLMGGKEGAFLYDPRYIMRTVVSSSDKLRTERISTMDALYNLMVKKGWIDEGELKTFLPSKPIRMEGETEGEYADRFKKWEMEYTSQRNKAILQHLPKLDVGHATEGITRVVDLIGSLRGFSFKGFGGENIGARLNQMAAFVINEAIKSAKHEGSAEPTPLYQRITRYLASKGGYKSFLAEGEAVGGYVGLEKEIMERYRRGLEGLDMGSLIKVATEVGLKNVPSKRAEIIDAILKATNLESFFDTIYEGLRQQFKRAFVIAAKEKGPEKAASLFKGGLSKEKILELVKNTEKALAGSAEQVDLELESLAESAIKRWESRVSREGTPQPMALPLRKIQTVLNMPYRLRTGSSNESGFLPSDILDALSSSSTTSSAAIMMRKGLSRYGAGAEWFYRLASKEGLSPADLTAKIMEKVNVSSVEDLGKMMKKLNIPDVQDILKEQMIQLSEGEEDIEGELRTKLSENLDPVKLYEARRRIIAMWLQGLPVMKKFLELVKSSSGVVMPSFPTDVKSDVFTEVKSLGTEKATVTNEVAKIVSAKKASQAAIPEKEDQRLIETESAPVMAAREASQIAATKEAIKEASTGRFKYSEHHYRIAELYLRDKTLKEILDDIGGGSISGLRKYIKRSGIQRNVDPYWWAEEEPESVSPIVKPGRTYGVKDREEEIEAEREYIEALKEETKVTNNLVGLKQKINQVLNSAISSTAAGGGAAGGGAAGGGAAGGGAAGGGSGGGGDDEEFIRKFVAYLQRMGLPLERATGPILEAARSAYDMGLSPFKAVLEIGRLERSRRARGLPPNVDPSQFEPVQGNLIENLRRLIQHASYTYGQNEMAESEMPAVIQMDLAQLREQPARRGRIGSQWIGTPTEPGIINQLIRSGEISFPQSQSIWKKFFLSIYEGYINQINRFEQQELEAISRGDLSAAAEARGRKEKSVERLVKKLLEEDYGKRSTPIQGRQNFRSIYQKLFLNRELEEAVIEGASQFLGRPIRRGEGRQSGRDILREANLGSIKETLLKTSGSDVLSPLEKVTFLYEQLLRLQEDYNVSLKETPNIIAEIVGALQNELKTARDLSVAQQTNLKRTLEGVSKIAKVYTYLPGRAFETNLTPIPTNITVEAQEAAYKRRMEDLRRFMREKPEVFMEEAAAGNIEGLTKKPGGWLTYKERIVDPMTGLVVKNVAHQFRFMGFEIDATGKKLGNFRYQMQDVTKEMAERGTLGQAFGRVLRWGFASGVIYGLVRAFREMVNTVKDVEFAIGGLQRVMDPATTNIDKLRQAGFSMAKALGADIRDVLDSMTVFAQQGMTQAEVIQHAWASVLAMNVAEGFEKAKDATEGLTAATKVYGSEGQSVMRFLDSWVEVGNKHAVTAATLADALKRAGSAAKAAGVDFDELNAIVTAIAAVTRQTGQEVGTALRFIFARMRTEKGPAALSRIGISTFTEAGEMKSAAKIFDEMAAKWKTLTDVEKIALAQAVAGARQYNSVITLMDNYDEKLSALIDSQKSSGTAVTRNSYLMETAAKKWAALTASVQEAQVAFGNVFLGPMKWMIDVVKGFIEVLSSIPGVIQGTIASILGLYTVLGRWSYFSDFSGGFKRTLADASMYLLSFIGLVRRTSDVVLPSGQVIAEQKWAWRGPREAYQSAREYALAKKILQPGEKIGDFSTEISGMWGQIFYILGVVGEKTNKVLGGMIKHIPGLRRIGETISMWEFATAGLVRAYGPLAAVLATVTGGYLLIKSAIDSYKKSGDDLLQEKQKELSQLDSIIKAYGKNTEILKNLRIAAEEYVNIQNRANEIIAEGGETAVNKAIEEGSYISPILVFDELKRKYMDWFQTTIKTMPEVISYVDDFGTAWLRADANLEKFSTNAENVHKIMAAYERITIAKAYTRDLTKGGFFQRLGEGIGVEWFGKLGDLKKLKDTAKDYNEALDLYTANPYAFRQKFLEKVKALEDARAAAATTLAKFERQMAEVPEGLGFKRLLELVPSKEIEETFEAIGEFKYRKSGMGASLMGRYILGKGGIQGLKEDARLTEEFYRDTAKGLGLKVKGYFKDLETDIVKAGDIVFIDESLAKKFGMQWGVLKVSLDMEGKKVFEGIGADSRTHIIKTSKDIAEAIEDLGLSVSDNVVRVYSGSLVRSKIKEAVDDLNTILSGAGQGIRFPGEIDLGAKFRTDLSLNVRLAEAFPVEYRKVYDQIKAYTELTEVFKNAHAADQESSLELIQLNEKSRKQLRDMQSIIGDNTYILKLRGAVLDLANAAEIASRELENTISMEKTRAQMLSAVAGITRGVPEYKPQNIKSPYEMTGAELEYYRNPIIARMQTVREEEQRRIESMVDRIINAQRTIRELRVFSTEREAALAEPAKYEEAMKEYMRQLSEKEKVGVSKDSIYQGNKIDKLRTDTVGALEKIRLELVKSNNPSLVNSKMQPLLSAGNMVEAIKRYSDISVSLLNTYNEGWSLEERANFPLAGANLLTEMQKKFLMLYNQSVDEWVVDNIRRSLKEQGKTYEEINKEIGDYVKARKPRINPEQGYIEFGKTIKELEGKGVTFNEPEVKHYVNQFLTNVLTDLSEESKRIGIPSEELGKAVDEIQKGIIPPALAEYVKRRGDQNIRANMDLLFTETNNFFVNIIKSVKDIANEQRFSFIRRELTGVTSGPFRGYPLFPGAPTSLGPLYHEMSPEQRVYYRAPGIYNEFRQIEETRNRLVDVLGNIDKEMNITAYNIAETEKALAAGMGDPYTLDVYNEKLRRQEEYYNYLISSIDYLNGRLEDFGDTLKKAIDTEALIKNIEEMSFAFQRWQAQFNLSTESIDKALGKHPFSLMTPPEYGVSPSLFKTKYEREEERIKAEKGYLPTEDKIRLDWQKKEDVRQYKQAKELEKLSRQYSEAQRIFDLLYDAQYRQGIDTKGLLETISYDLEHAGDISRWGGELQFRGIPSLNYLSEAIQPILQEAEAKKYEMAAQPIVDPIVSKLEEIRLAILGIDLTSVQETIPYWNLDNEVFNAAESVEVPSFSYGGIFRGKGTPKSDSNLIKLSEGDYVLRYESVKKYGNLLTPFFGGIDIGSGVLAAISDQEAIIPGSKVKGRKTLFDKINAGVATLADFLREAEFNPKSIFGTYQSGVYQEGGEIISSFWDRFLNKAVAGVVGNVPFIGSALNLTGIISGKTKEDILSSLVGDKFGRNLIGVVADLVPGISQAKSLFETISGYDPITGEDTSRVLSGLSLLPFGFLAKLSTKIQPFLKETQSFAKSTIVNAGMPLVAERILDMTSEIGNLGGKLLEPLVLSFRKSALLHGQKALEEGYNLGISKGGDPELLNILVGEAQRLNPNIKGYLAYDSREGLFNQLFGSKIGAAHRTFKDTGEEMLYFRSSFVDPHVVGHEIGHSLLPTFFDKFVHEQAAVSKALRKSEKSTEKGFWEWMEEYRADVRGEKFLKNVGVESSFMDAYSEGMKYKFDMGLAKLLESPVTQDVATTTAISTGIQAGTNLLEDIFGGYKKGGFVDRDRLAFLHGGEVVIPSSLVRSYQEGGETEEKSKLEKVWDWIYEKSTKFGEWIMGGNPTEMEEGMREIKKLQRTGGIRGYAEGGLLDEDLQNVLESITGKSGIEYDWLSAKKIKVMSDYVAKLRQLYTQIKAEQRQYYYPGLENIQSFSPEIFSTINNALSSYKFSEKGGLGGILPALTLPSYSSPEGILSKPLPVITDDYYTRQVRYGLPEGNINGMDIERFSAFSQEFGGNTFLSVLGPKYTPIYNVPSAGPSYGGYSPSMYGPTAMTMPTAGVSRAYSPTPSSFEVMKEPKEVIKQFAMLSPSQQAFLSGGIGGFGGSSFASKFRLYQTLGPEGETEAWVSGRYGGKKEKLSDVGIPIAGDSIRKLAEAIGEAMRNVDLKARLETDTVKLDVGEGLRNLGAEFTSLGKEVSQNRILIEELKTKLEDIRGKDTDGSITASLEENIHRLEHSLNVFENAMMMHASASIDEVHQAQAKFAEINNQLTEIREQMSALDGMVRNASRVAAQASAKGEL